MWCTDIHSGKTLLTIKLSYPLAYIYVCTYAKILQLELDLKYSEGSAQSYMKYKQHHWQSLKLSCNLPLSVFEAFNYKSIFKNQDNEIEK